MANKTIVSNPYNFNINSNVSFSTTINAVLPDKETILYEAYDYTYEFIDLVIPSGVKVVEVWCFAEIIESDDNFYATAGVTSYLNDKYNKTWGYVEVRANDSDSVIKYVGVTPGKTYRLSVACSSDLGSAHVMISYSNEINAHAVDVEDY